MFLCITVAEKTSTFKYVSAYSIGYSEATSFVFRDCCATIAMS
jgi:hypothetical protein